jgi:hypothetical protein
MAVINKTMYNKKRMQFIIIFISLAILLPILYLLSSQQGTDDLNAEQQTGVNQFAQFNAKKNSIIKKITLIDSCFNDLTAEKGNIEPASLIATIKSTNQEIIELDSSEVTKLINVMINNWVGQAYSYKNNKEELSKLGKEKEESDKKAMMPIQMPIAPGAGGDALPNPQGLEAPTTENME